MTTATWHRIRLYCSISSAVLLLLVGCGRKGPPVPRAAIVPPPIRDLEAKILGDRIQLTWSVPQQGGVVLKGISRFKVFSHTVHRSAPPCPGCPLSFEEIREITLSNPAPARMKDGRVAFAVAYDAAFRYAFKVLVYHKSGGVSGDSNIVRVPAN